MTYEVPDIVTPCCGAQLIVVTAWEGGYMGENVPYGIACNGYLCGNSWLPDGKSDEYNRMPKRKEEG